MTLVQVKRRADGRNRVTGWVALSRDEKDARIETARSMLRTSNWNEISFAAGVPYDALRRALDPTYQAKKCERINAARQHRSISNKGRPKADGTPAHFNDPKPIEADVAARLAEIPPDTRDLTARLFGDPLPGRRAIDRRSA